MLTSLTRTEVERAMIDDELIILGDGERGKFRPGVHVPKGVTAEGVIEDYRLVHRIVGHVAVESTVRLILEDETRLPSVRAFGPESPEQAYIDGMKDGVRTAFNAVIVVRQGEEGKKLPPTHIRLFHNVQREGIPERTYEPIRMIARDRDLTAQLTATLSHDAELFSVKMTATLKELAVLMKLKGEG